MKKHKLLKIAGVYFCIFFLFTLIFILSFHSPLFLNQKVLFYRGLTLLAVSTIITLLFTIPFKKQTKASLETLIAAIILTISFHISFFVIFPVTFDRSVTMYLLSTLKEKTIHQYSNLSEEKLEKLFIDEYVINDKAIRRRIIEQSIISMVQEKDNYINLTPKGQNFLNLSEIIKKLYAIK